MAITIAALIAGCETPSPQKESPPAVSAAAPPPAAAKPAELPPAPVPAQPELTPALAKQQAQKLALEAVDQLQTGDEASATQTLERALALDPGNELARKMREQVRADPQKELGAVFFRYTVQRDDTLAKLAQQYLGDRFRFYILAKYNNITNPGRLGVGEVIKIPGRAPPPVAAPSAPAGEAGTRPATSDTETRPRDEISELLAKGNALQRSGDLEGAYATFVEAAQRAPSNAEAVRRRDAAKVALVQRYDREATQAFQRQNLDLAISKWDRILEIDPANRKARLERERAQDLKRRLAEKFGQ